MTDAALAQTDHRNHENQVNDGSIYLPAGATWSWPYAPPDMFLPEHPTAVEDIALDLRTNLGQMLFCKQYFNAQKALYFLYKVLPRQSKDDPSVLNEVQQIVERRFERVERATQNELRRLSSLGENLGTMQHSRYSHDGNICVQSFHKKMTLWLNLLQDVDNIMRWVDALLFSSGITDDESNKTEVHWRDMIAGFTRELNNLQLRASNYSRQPSADQPVPDGRYLKLLGKGLNDDMSPGIDEKQKDLENGTAAKVEAIVQANMKRRKRRQKPASQRHVPAERTVEPAKPTSTEQAPAKSKANGHAKPQPAEPAAVAG